MYHPLIIFLCYRQTSSTVHENLHRSSQDFQVKSIVEKMSNSSGFNNRNTSDYVHRTSSPSYVRASSPNNPTTGGDYIASKNLNEKRHDVSSSNYPKKNEFDDGFNKRSSVRIPDTIANSTGR